MLQIAQCDKKNTTIFPFCTLAQTYIYKPVERKISDYLQAKYTATETGLAGANCATEREDTKEKHKARLFVGQKLAQPLRLPAWIIPGDMSLPTINGN